MQRLVSPTDSSGLTKTARVGARQIFEGDSPSGLVYRHGQPEEVRTELCGPSTDRSGVGPTESVQLGSVEAVQDSPATTPALTACPGVTRSRGWLPSCPLRCRLVVLLVPGCRVALRRPGAGIPARPPPRPPAGSWHLAWASDPAPASAFGPLAVLVRGLTGCVTPLWSSAFLPVPPATVVEQPAVAGFPGGGVSSPYPALRVEDPSSPGRPAPHPPGRGAAPRPTH